MPAEAELLFAIGLFGLGLIIGSFLNVLVLRYRSGRSLSGRSGCLSCNTPLGALELVPVLSFLALRGRCRHCRSAISFQYPLVELSTGCLFLGALLVFDPLPAFSASFLLALCAYLVCMSALVALVVYDLRHQIIPDAFVLAFGLAALLFNLFRGEMLGEYLLASLTLALPFAALWFFSRGRWMGLGDAKLAAGIGALLGLSQGFTAIVLGFWSGALVGMFLLGITRVVLRLSSGGVPLTMKSEVPFAPFLALGTVLTLFSQFSLFGPGALLSLF